MEEQVSKPNDEPAAKPVSGHYVDEMLRVTRQHHIQLSSMADVKANIMLTLASLVLTFSIRYLSDPVLRWPVLTLTFFCLVTIFMAAYAVMPKRMGDRRYDPKNPSSNILFFGTFLNWSLEEYAEAMNSIMQSPQTTYEMQIREIYELGQFLGRKKYRFIRFSYVSFIVGFLLSGIVFVIVELIALQMQP